MHHGYGKQTVCVCVWRTSGTRAHVRACVRARAARMCICISVFLSVPEFVFVCRCEPVYVKRENHLSWSEVEGVGRTIMFLLVFC